MAGPDLRFDGGNLRVALGDSCGLRPAFACHLVETQPAATSSFPTGFTAAHTRAVHTTWCRATEDRPGAGAIGGQNVPFPVCPGDSAHTATLLTNGLCRRDKRRPRAARPAFRPLAASPRPALPGLASRKNLVLWAVFAVFVGPVKRLTAFRSEYLAPQERRSHGSGLWKA